MLHVAVFALRVKLSRRLTSTLIWSEILFEKVFVLEGSDHS